MEEKIQWYKEVLTLEPNSRLFFPLAVLLSEHGQLEEALETLRLGLERHDEYLEARIFYIELLYSAKRMEEIRPQLAKLEGMFSHYMGFWQAWAAYIAHDGNSMDASSIMRFLSLYFTRKTLSLHEIIDRGIQAILQDEVGASAVDEAGDISESTVNPEPLLSAADTEFLDSLDAEETPEETVVPEAPYAEEPVQKPVPDKTPIDPSFGTLVTIDKEAEKELWSLIAALEKSGGHKQKTVEEAPKQESSTALEGRAAVPFEANGGYGINDESGFAEETVQDYAPGDNITPDANVEPEQENFVAQEEVAASLDPSYEGNDAENFQAEGNADQENLLNREAENGELLSEGMHHAEVLQEGEDLSAMDASMQDAEVQPEAMQEEPQSEDLSAMDLSMQDAEVQPEAMQEEPQSEDLSAMDLSMQDAEVQPEAMQEEPQSEELSAMNAQDMGVEAEMAASMQDAEVQPEAMQEEPQSEDLSAMNAQDMGVETENMQEADFADSSMQEAEALQEDMPHEAADEENQGSAYNTQAVQEVPEALTDEAAAVQEGADQLDSVVEDISVSPEALDHDGNHESDPSLSIVDGDAVRVHGEAPQTSLDLDTEASMDNGGGSRAYVHEAQNADFEAEPVLHVEPSSLYADEELADSSNPLTEQFDPESVSYADPLDAILHAQDTDDVSLRTRSMAEVLAEQGDIRGALDIYCELEGEARSVEEEADLKQRITTLRALLARQRVQEAKNVAPVKIDKSRVINLIEALSERLEARAQH